MIVQKMISLLTALIVCYFHGSQPVTDVRISSDWTENRMIAHAMGGIDGVAYTNSYEAFLQNYENGHRVFEVDLILTADGQLAARHDWYAYLSEELGQEVPEDRQGQTWTLEEFLSYPILNQYTPMSLTDVTRLLAEYPDIYIVTDTKETDLNTVRRQFELIRDTANSMDGTVLNRIIPEIYTQDMYEAVMSIYAFPNKLYSLYLSDEPAEETIRFVSEKGIQTVAMPVERAEAMPELVDGLAAAGVKIYVHTVNTEEEVKALEEAGVYGFYTDFLPGVVVSGETG